MDRYGYWNKILHVNLSDRTTRIEEPGDAFFRRYAGGRGLIARHRGLTLARLFNLREGMSRADDRLPARFSDPLPKHAGLSREQQDKIVTDYYVEQGWDAKTGVPTAETIRALELEADAVHAR